MYGDYINQRRFTAEQLALIERLTAGLPEDMHIEKRGFTRFAKGTLFDLNECGRSVAVTVAETERSEPGAGMTLITRHPLNPSDRCSLVVPRPEAGSDRFRGALLPSVAGRREADKSFRKPHYYTVFLPETKTRA